MTAVERARFNKNLRKILGITVTILLALLYLFPFYLAITTSFKTAEELSQSVFSLPKTFGFENYIIAMEKSNFTIAMKNSVITTCTTVILIVICTSMGGYAIARNSKRISFRILEKMYLAALMIPFQILMIPLYKMYKTLGMQNSLPGVIIVLVGTSIAYASFLYVGFVKSIPIELEEAAALDGCDPFRTFWAIVFPLLKPITSTVAALHVMWIWNEFNVSLILLQKEEVRTLPIKQFYFFGEYSVDYNYAFAAAIISMVPIVIFFLFAQRYLVAGITVGAVKT